MLVISRDHQLSPDGAVLQRARRVQVSKSGWRRIRALSGGQGLRLGALGAIALSSLRGAGIERRASKRRLLIPAAGGGFASPRYAAPDAESFQSRDRTLNGRLPPVYCGDALVWSPVWA